MRTAFLLCVLFGLLALTTTHATVYFHEEFKTLDHWTNSKHRDDYGKVEISAGKVYADAEKSKGLRFTEDARFYALSTAFSAPITNDNKDLVVSFSVKDEQDLKCGGGYIKLLPEMEPEKFNGDTKYWLMFGPDRCGWNKKVHIIFHYNGKNYEWKRNTVSPHEDKLTHAYTLHIMPGNKYEFFLDGESRAKGSLEDDWDMLEPREIIDPEDKKPEDWVDKQEIDDPNDTKPDDWDAEPEMIPDAEAKRPEDWNDEEDGAWEPPSVPNPNYKGLWVPRRIPNPEYKGPWNPRMIRNPKFQPDENLYKSPEPLAHVGIDLWIVEGGSIIKDIIIGDDIKEVLDLVQQTHGSMKEAEKKAFDAMQKAEAAEEAEAAKEENEGEEETGHSEEGDL